jgi:acetylornithine deacetylase
MRCQVHGAACHSAYAPYGVNAIEYAARLIGKLGEIGDELARPEHHDERFDPPFSTVQTGVIKGGRALNIVPAECEFDFECARLPGSRRRRWRTSYRPMPSRVAAAYAQGHAASAIRLEPLSAYPGLATPQTARLRSWWRCSVVRILRHGGVWYRRWAVRPGGHPHRGVRAWQHGPGAQAG